MSLHHSFEVDLACKYGMESAALIHHLQYWIRHNKSLKRNFKEGKTWSYQTLREIKAHFPYWSIKQTERNIKKLIDQGVIIKGNFNNSPYDRTIWYAFKDEILFGIDNIKSELENEDDKCISRNREIENSKSGNQNPEIGKPIPDNIPYNITKEQEREGLSPHSLSSSFSNENLEKQKNSNITDIIRTSKSPKAKRNEPSQEKKLYGEFVQLTEAEYQKLTQKYPKEKLDWMIEYLDAKIGANEYKRKSHYHVLQPVNWVSQEYEKAQKEKTRSFSRTFQIPEDQVKIINERRDKSQEFFAKFRLNLDQRGIRFQILEKALQINNDIIDFRDNKFNDLVRNSLSKFGWVVPQKNPEKQLAMT